MSNEEAIYTLKNMAFLDVERDHEKTEEAIKTAISALEEIDRIKAERDAAIDDMRGFCVLCKFFKVNVSKLPCAKCLRTANNEYWEWKGVQNG